MAVSRVQLLTWSEQGDQVSFRRARRAQRRHALWRLWTAFGLKLGQCLSPILLGVLYLSVFVPFGLAGRLARPRRGWLAVRRAPGKSVAALRSPA